jgi:hypothetical protein
VGARGMDKVGGGKDVPEEEERGGTAGEERRTDRP